MHAQGRNTRTALSAAIHIAIMTLALGAGGYSAIAQAQALTSPSQPAAGDFRIKAGSLANALEQFGKQSGLHVLYEPSLVAGLRAPSVSGRLVPSEALKLLLVGSGLRHEAVGATTLVLKRDPNFVPPPSKKKVAPASTPVQAEARAETNSLETLVVVGSRLGSSPVESAMPIKVITRDEIERSGAGNIAQVISYLSEVSINNSGDRPIGGGDSIGGNGNTNSSTVQMRGLPRGTTLVLINGRRAGETASYSDTGQFDLSTVPLSLVERIEVLPAGSSAVYGGDALAGVVNIVLRKDVSGLEFRARNSASDGYESNQVGVMWGKTWDRADLSISATWRENGSLYNSERSLTADQDYRRFGGRDYRNASSYPATVYSLAGCPPTPASCSKIPLANRGNLPGLDSPVAVVPEGSDGIGLTPEDFRATQGQRNLTSVQHHFRSGEENYSINSAGRIKLGDNVEAFAELMYSRRKVPAYQNLFTLTSGSSGYLYSRIPADHPFNPFGVEVGVDFRFTETGIFTEYSQTHTRGVLGLRGNISRFEWEVSGWQARDEGISSGGGGFDSGALMAAVNSKDPALTFNPFASDGSLPASTELMESWLFNVNQRSTSRVTGLTGTVRGTLAELPAGKLVGLVGVEQQKFIVGRESNNDSFVIPNLDAESTSKAYFAEARIPLVSARPGDSFERVAVTGAFRHESSDRFDEDAKTQTFGLEFRPFQSLLLRGTYSTAFKPPLTFTSAVVPFTYMDSVLDPRFGGDSYEFLVEAGGGISPGLRPETSDNITFGFLYRPSSLWSISLTNWDIEFIDRMTYLSTQSIVDHENYYPGRVVRDPVTGLINYVDTRPVNIAAINTSGIDIGIDRYISTSIGDFQASVAATYTYKYKQQDTPESEVVSSLAQLNTLGWAPRWKIVPRLTWDNQKWLRAMLVGRYISGYRDSAPLSTGERTGEYLNLGDFWMFDLNVDASLSRFTNKASYLAGFNLNVGVRNLFNKLPDFCAGCRSRGYDSTQYDIDGRTIYAEARMSF